MTDPPLGLYNLPIESGWRPKHQSELKTCPAYFIADALAETIHDPVFIIQRDFTLPAEVTPGDRAILIDDGSNELEIHTDRAHFTIYTSLHPTEIHGLITKYKLRRLELRGNPYKPLVWSTDITRITRV